VASLRAAGHVFASGATLRSAPRILLEAGAASVARGLSAFVGFDSSILADMSKRKVLEAALALPVDERAELAREIIASLDGSPDEGADDAWIDEIDRRVREVEAGTVETVDWPEAERRVMERLRRVRSR
jgi:putative addiction module component (TIGR02574 family)